MGTTSACAENTITGSCAKTAGRNYLRVRGEYGESTPRMGSFRELPPRARRIRLGHPCGTHGPGTTSACAENTLPGYESPPSKRNYLRVRGEYPSLKITAVRGPELPPRARRIQTGKQLPPIRKGTTSACAENTNVMLTRTDWQWNYLRVRGEY